MGARSYTVSTINDTTTYRKYVGLILDKYPPELVVCENEPINPHFHSGPISDYLVEYNICAQECAKRKIPCTSGGIYGGGLIVPVYRWLKSSGRLPDASAFEAYLNQRQLNAAKQGSNEKIKEMENDVISILEADKKYGKYANIHPYEPMNVANQQDSNINSITPHILQLIQQYIKTEYGLETITNETGQRNNVQPALVTNLLAEYKRLGFPYVIWFSGEGGDGARSLTDDATGALQPNGKAFRDYIVSH